MSSPFTDNHAEHIKRAANHLHEIGDMSISTTEHGAHVKGYSAAHHRKARVMARALDRVHGFITKAEEVAEDEKLTREEGQPGDYIEVEKGLDLNDPAFVAELRRLEQQRKVTDEKVATLHYQATGKRA